MVNTNESPYVAPDWEDNEADVAKEDTVIPFEEDVFNDDGGFPPAATEDLPEHQPILDYTSIDGTEDGVQGGYPVSEDDLREKVVDLWNTYLADKAQQAVEHAQAAAERAEAAAYEAYQHGQAMYEDRRNLWQRFVDWVRGY